MSELGLSKEDIAFLKNLQHEMLTQDHVGQAAPRFWVVRGTEKIYGVEDDYDGFEVYDRDGEIMGDTLKEVFEFLCENHEFDKVTNSRYDKESGSLIVDGETFYDLEDFVNKYEYEYDISISKYRNVEFNYENTMFLTNKECNEHIAKNYYHYSRDAHSYAMTAWRSQEVGRLWNILDKINWDKVETLLDK